MAEKVDSPDLLVSKIAERQHGVVTIRQLHTSGLSDDAVRGRVISGRLHRVQRSVYAVGHPGISHYGRWMAAALTCGEGAAVSHRSAAELWALLQPGGGLIDVSVPSGNGRAKRRGIQVYRRASLSSDVLTRRFGIPVTKPTQTIADLRRVVSAKELRRAIRQADVLGLPIGPDVSRDRTRSDLERGFLRLCQRHRLPMPEVNVRIGRFLVDFLWRDWRLVVETDGFRYHRGRQAFEDDHARELDLRAQGYDVMRFSYRQVTAEPGRVADAVRDALSP